jgi:DNA replication and repair protein RecF
VRLLALQAVGFRNLEPLDLTTDASFIVVHGPNAQGKTNLLEAVYLLATLRPLRARRLQELVRWGEQATTIAATVNGGGLTRRYKLTVGPDGRTSRIDDKKAELPDWFEGIRAIAFTPGDGEIVLGGPAERRGWIDRAAFTKAPRHLEVVRAFNKGLSQKAAALRQPGTDPMLLDALDEQLAGAAARLVQRRIDILEELRPRVQALHREIAGGDGVEIDLRYRSPCLAGEGDLVRRWRTVFARNRREELRRRTTMAGPQRDDVDVLLGGQSARTYGSRGQVRSVVLALKLAELVAARDRGEVPLFLLDDLSSELDRARTARLVGTLADLGAQVLITTTDPGHLDALPPSQTLMVSMAQGVVHDVQRQG